MVARTAKRSSVNNNKEKVLINVGLNGAVVKFVDLLPEDRRFETHLKPLRRDLGQVPHSQ